MNKVKHLSKLKKKAYKLWSENVRKIGHCELCGKQYKEINEKGKPTILDAHHIIGRENHRLSWDLKNGISLCKYCHKWSYSGPHKGSIIFAEWYRLSHPDNHSYLLQVYKEEVNVDIPYVENIIKGLESVKVL